MTTKKMTKTKKKTKKSSVRLDEMLLAEALAEAGARKLHFAEGTDYCLKNGSGSALFCPGETVACCAFGALALRDPRVAAGEIEANSIRIPGARYSDVYFGNDDSASATDRVGLGYMVGVGFRAAMKE